MCVLGASTHFLVFWARLFSVSLLSFIRFSNILLGRKRNSWVSSLLLKLPWYWCEKISIRKNSIWTCQPGKLPLFPRLRSRTSEKGAGSLKHIIIIYGMWSFSRLKFLRPLFFSQQDEKIRRNTSHFINPAKTLFGGFCGREWVEKWIKSS